MEKQQLCNIKCCYEKNRRKEGLGNHRAKRAFFKIGDCQRLNAVDNFKLNLFYIYF